MVPWKRSGQSPRPFFAKNPWMIGQPVTWLLVGSQPIWKICWSKWVHLPKVRGELGEQSKKYLSCHHFVVFSLSLLSTFDFLSHNNPNKANPQKNLQRSWRAWLGRQPNAIPETNKSNSQSTWKSDGLKTSLSFFRVQNGLFSVLRMAYYIFSSEDAICSGCFADSFREGFLLTSFLPIFHLERITLLGGSSQLVSMVSLRPLSMISLVINGCTVTPSTNHLLSVMVLQVPSHKS